MNWKGKRVLLIGAPAEAALHVLKDEAELVEVMPASGKGEHPARLLADWIKANHGNKTKLQVRGVTGATLQDRDEWDAIVLNRISEQDLPIVVSRAQLALNEAGQILAGRTLLATDEVLAPPPAPVPFKADANRGVILHVHNVRRCGGTGNFVYDMARCFPEFRHVALCVNDPAGDARWINDVSGEMRTMYSPQLTRALLEEIDPKIVVLHATVGNKLEGAWPYDWLSDGGRRYVIALHHIPTYPLLPADLDVFVSEYIKAKYEKFLSRMRSHVVLPPCTDMAPYEAVKRDVARPFLATTGGKACAEFHEAAKELPNWTFDSSPPGRIGQFAGYLGRFPFAVVWSGAQETWCRTVSEAMAAGCLVVAHEAGAIPEQITPGKNGYLFQDRGSLVAVMEKIELLPAGRLNEIAQAGREWAVEHVGFDRMRRGLYPYLMKATLGTA